MLHGEYIDAPTVDGHIPALQQATTQRSEEIFSWWLSAKKCRMGR
jgi:ABC-type uncharacterized transport system auxiliary subunit